MLELVLALGQHLAGALEVLLRLGQIGLGILVELIALVADLAGEIDTWRCSFSTSARLTSPRATRG